MPDPETAEDLFSFFVFQQCVKKIEHRSVSYPAVPPIGQIRLLLFERREGVNVVIVVVDAERGFHVPEKLDQRARLKHGGKRT